MDSIEKALQKAKSWKTLKKPAEHQAPPKTPVQRLPQASVPSNMEEMRSPTSHLDREHLERHRIIAHSRENPNSAAFHLLRTTLLQKMRAIDACAIGIVAPSQSVGKTMLAINLAMSIARLPESTALLVDMDLRSPKVTKYLGLEEGQGMTDFLQGRCDFESTLLYPELPRFVVAPAGSPVLNSSELLASRLAVDLIEDAKTRYSNRVVIFDLPPLLYGDDTIAILPKMDGVLLALAHGVTSKDDIVVSMRHLANSTLLGTVLNKAPIDIEGATYGFGSG